MDYFAICFSRSFETPTICVEAWCVNNAHHIALTAVQKDGEWCAWKPKVLGRCDKKACGTYRESGKDPTPIDRATEQWFSEQEALNRLGVAP